VTPYIISAWECFKNRKIQIVHQNYGKRNLLTFITIRLQTRRYECYNKNTFYFSSHWRRLLFVPLIPNGSLYALNSAACVEMKVFPTVTIKVTVFSHVTPCSCLYKHHFREIPCVCFLKMKAEVPSELLAPITQQHDVISRKTNLKSVVQCTGLQWNRGAP
jgi:hypothetical protein